MKLHPTKNDLSQKTRETVIGLLNKNLASAVHLTVLAKQAHWNVKGAHFSPLHALFDEVYDDAGDWADGLAERAVQLGGTAEASLEKISAESALSPISLGVSDGRALVDALSTAVATFTASARNGIDAAASTGDQGTSDLFTEIVRAADKKLWMLEAHLQGE